MKKQRNYKRASLPELQCVFEMSKLGRGIREIARFLKRSPSTISNWLNQYRPGHGLTWLYFSPDKKARFVFERLKLRSVLGRREPIRDIGTRSYVISKLEEGLSPEVISATMFDEIGKAVSFKTIYNLTNYSRGLKKYLYEKGKSRRQKVVNRRSRRKEAAPNIIPIHSRSEAGNERQEFGHLEADLIIGTKGSDSSILSVIERLSRRKFFRKIPNRKSETILAYLIPILDQIPESLLLSISFDNGPEFAPSAMHKLKKRYSRIEVYYCDPYCASQKGAIERGNRDLRKFHPKKTNFDKVSKFEIKRLESKINNTPMKLLGFDKPLDIFQSIISRHEKLFGSLAGLSA